jgi:hypothetical protein
MFARFEGKIFFYIRIAFLEFGEQAFIGEIEGMSAFASV